MRSAPGRSATAALTQPLLVAQKGLAAPARRDLRWALTGPWGRPPPASPPFAHPSHPRAQPPCAAPVERDRTTARPLTAGVPGARHRHVTPAERHGEAARAPWRRCRRSPTWTPMTTPSIPTADTAVPAPQCRDWCAPTLGRSSESARPRVARSARPWRTVHRGTFGRDSRAHRREVMREAQAIPQVAAILAIRIARNA